MPLTRAKGSPPLDPFESTTSPFEARALGRSLVKLAQLANIPRENWDSFAEYVAIRLQYVIGYVRAGLPTDAQMGAALFRAVAEVSVPLVAAARELGRLEERYQQNKLRLASCGDPLALAWDHLDMLLKKDGGMAPLLRSLTIAARVARAHVRAGTKGRPAARVWLQELVQGIEVCALECGGHFTVSGTTGGKLVLALEHLRPHLPGGVLPAPDAHPLSTYCRFLKTAEAIFRGDDFRGFRYLGQTIKRENAQSQLSPDERTALVVEGFLEGLGIKLDTD